MKKSYRVSVPLVLLTPFVALAAGVVDSINSNIVGPIQSIVSTLIPIAIGLLLVAFFWGLAKYLFSAGDPEKQKEGKHIMLWGTIALVVAFSIWGIIATVGSTLGITPGSAGDVNDLIPTGI